MTLFVCQKHMIKSLNVLEMPHVMRVCPYTKSCHLCGRSADYKLFYSIPDPYVTEQYRVKSHLMLTATKE